jgi:hypothetical protein
MHCARFRCRTHARAVIGRIARSGPPSDPIRNPFPGIASFPRPVPTDRPGIVLLSAITEGNGRKTRSRTLLDDIEVKP